MPFSGVSGCAQLVASEETGATARACEERVVHADGTLPWSHSR